MSRTSLSGRRSRQTLCRFTTRSLCTCKVLLPVLLCSVADPENIPHHRLPGELEPSGTEGAGYEMQVSCSAAELEAHLD